MAVLREFAERLLKRLGDPGECRACHATISWVKVKGVPHPFDLTGLSHFATCEQAEQFRKKPDPATNGARR